MRTEAGRFVKGVSGNPSGRPRSTVTSEERLQIIIVRKVPGLIEEAFKRAKTNDAVMAGLLNLLAVMHSTEEQHDSLLQQGGTD